MDGVFQNVISTVKKCFQHYSNKVTSIASIDAFVIISRDVFMHFTWRVKSVLEYLFVKFQVFTINRTDTCSTIKKLRHIIVYKTMVIYCLDNSNVSVKLFFTFSQSGCFWKYPSKQKHVQTRRLKKTLELL